MFLLLKAFDRLQQRNEKLWDAIKKKSEETDSSLVKTEKNESDKKGRRDVDFVVTASVCLTYLALSQGVIYLQKKTNLS